jgi:M6 family metalloprotease-like protein
VVESKVGYCILAVILLSTLFVLSAPEEKVILGLASPSDGWRGEGLTNTERNLRAVGTVRAMMLFAMFPDSEEGKTPRKLYDQLVPSAVQFFEKSSYGQFDLIVDAHFEWLAMKKPSTHPGYDNSRYKTYKAYVTEVMAAADPEVDFSAYSIVYVVASKSPGNPISPPFLVAPGKGVRGDGHEIRYAVTFGNDSRNRGWTWQTLVHETGHILGLPDLYSYDFQEGGRKSTFQFVGSWDPMSYQRPEADFLAWHKYKLGWLKEDRFVIVKEGSITLEVTHLESRQGVKALVLPISKYESYVAEVRHLNPSRSRVGVLIYKVSTRMKSGKGLIRVMPAVEDDDQEHPALFKKYIAHYNALYFASDHFEDEASRVRIDILRKTDAGFELKVSR